MQNTPALQLHNSFAQTSSLSFFLSLFPSSFILFHAYTHHFLQHFLYTINIQSCIFFPLLPHHQLSSMTTWMIILWTTMTTTTPISYVDLATRLLDQTGSAQIVTRNVPPVAGYWHKTRMTIALVVGYMFLLEISMFPAIVNLLPWWNPCLRLPTASHLPTSIITSFPRIQDTSYAYIYPQWHTFIDITLSATTTTTPPLVPIVHIYNLPFTFRRATFPFDTISLFLPQLCLVCCILFVPISAVLPLSSLLYIIRTHYHTHKSTMLLC